MDVVNLLKNLSDHITCSICLEVFDEPRTLDCGHAYCLKCIKRIKRDRGNEPISCPDCRKPSDVECGNEDALPVAFYINSLIDVFRIKECETTAVKCLTCSSKASSYCFQCSEFLCEAECLPAHGIVKLTTSHKVLALPLFTDVDIQHVIERQAFCSIERHRDELKKYFCLECKVPVCQKCTTVEHAGHRFEVIEETVDKAKNELRVKIDGVKDKLQEVLAAKQEMTGEKITIENERQGVEQELNETLDKIKKCFKKLIQDNGEKAAKVQSKVDKQLNTACGMEDEARNLISDATSALSTILPGTIGSNAMNELEQKLNLIQNKQIEPIEKVGFTGYRPSDEFEKVLQEENFGRIHQCTTFLAKCSVQGSALEHLVEDISANITVSTRNSRGELVYCADDDVMVLVKARDDSITEDVSSVSDAKTGEYEFRVTPSALTEYEVSVKVNGKELQQSPFFVRATQRQFKVVKLFGKRGNKAGEFRYPVGLSVDKDGNIAVCDYGNHRVQVFNSNGDLVTRPFGMDVLSNPTFTAHLGNAGNHGNQILVSDEEKGVIQMFTIDGAFVKTFFRVPGNEMHGLSIDAGDGNVIVCLGNECIKVLSPEGEVLRVLVSEKEGITPSCCVYHDGKYYVTDRRARSVKVFNEHGQCVQEFRDRDGNVHKLYGPMGIAIDKNGRVIVCDYSGHKLHVYHRGVLMKTIGSKGDKPGEFDGPWDVKILPCGRIVVSDFGNHRIQILE